MHGYLRSAGTCRAYESSVLGHRSVVLENRLLRATVLVERGAALFELVWKPGGLDMLWRWERGIRPPGYPATSRASPCRRETSRITSSAGGT